jgi:hypothetical protein
MDIQIIGPWVLLAVGAFILVIAAIKHVRSTQPGKGWPWAWVFGLGTAGVGLYGPTFLVPYAEFLKPLMGMVDSPNAETYASAFEAVGRNEIPPDYQEVALAYALDRPIPEMEPILARAVDQAPEGRGKEALAQSLESLKARKRMALKAAEAPPSRPDEPGPSIEETIANVEELDPASRALLDERALLRGRAQPSDDERRRLRVLTGSPRVRRAAPKKD